MNSPTSVTSEDHQKIASAIREAESRTSGEIYCVVARSSDSYFFPAAFALSVAILLLSFGVSLFLHFWWFSIQIHVFVGAQLLALVSALAVIWLFPALRIHLVPRYLQYRRAHANAAKQFLARNVHITSARTGVLIFVSLAERYAEIVADSGINQRVEQDKWNAIVADLIEHARQKRLTEGFLGAIAAVASLLEAHFPIRQGDVNELDDHLVEI
ncbi:TPM domain-containing protein [Mesorhizobium sp. SB112]|uniref:TPM domain-containing protein n=1 Tax=Mesorhizobium sp. SB112 TaxID=3151853 RepID=UPI0032645713